MTKVLVVAVFVLAAISAAIASCGGDGRDLSVRLHNADDELFVYLNGENQGNVGFNTSMTVELEDVQAEDRISFRLYNGDRGYAAGITVEDENGTVFVRRFGDSGVVGANNNDLHHRHQYVFGLTIDRDGQICREYLVRAEEPSNPRSAEQRTEPLPKGAPCES